jgi:hypothetical protein
MDRISSKRRKSQPTMLDVAATAGVSAAVNGTAPDVPSQLLASLPYLVTILVLGFGRPSSFETERRCLARRILRTLNASILAWMSSRRLANDGRIRVLP